MGEIQSDQFSKENPFSHQVDHSLISAKQNELQELQNINTEGTTKDTSGIHMHARHPEALYRGIELLIGITSLCNTFLLHFTQDVLEGDIAENGRLADKLGALTFEALPASASSAKEASVSAHNHDVMTEQSMIQAQIQAFGNVESMHTSDASGFTNDEQQLGSIVSSLVNFYSTVGQNLGSIKF